VFTLALDSLVFHFFLSFLTFFFLLPFFPFFFFLTLFCCCPGPLAAPFSKNSRIFNGRFILNYGRPPSFICIRTKNEFLILGFFPSFSISLSPSLPPFPTSHYRPCGSLTRSRSLPMGCAGIPGSILPSFLSSAKWISIQVYFPIFGRGLNSIQFFSSSFYRFFRYLRRYLCVPFAECQFNSYCARGFSE
jgi:hypothetical protein